MAVSNSQQPGKRKRIFGWLQGSYAALLFSAAILGVAVVLYLVIAGPFSEAHYVQPNKFQAVFLNMNNGQTNQVYFGRVTELNSRFVRLLDIYYIQSTPSTDSAGKQTTQNTLKKLGCEVHGPQDEMIINRDQIIFWENLKDDGQVVKKIIDFKKQNPEGQKCTSAAASSTQNPSTGTSTTPAQ